MSSVSVHLPLAQQSRSQTLFLADLKAISRRVDWIFVGLLLFEWLLGIAIACLVSPYTWIGTTSTVHEHVYAAVYLGALIISFPIFLVWLCPGTVASRYAVAASQMIYSSLLIHLTGGRIETHFHVFGSLAFLAMYRDWRLLLTASAIVALDHAWRGVWWPESVYAVAAVTPWRWVEHITWVLFEDVVLIVAIRQSLREMHAIAIRQAALEDATHRAESADRAKGAFLAQMSHEIRTPMTAILGYADMMAIEGDSPESAQAIRRNGRHLLAVLDDILDLSKIEAEQLRIEKSPVDVAELLRDVQHLMAPRASARSLTLALELQNLPPVLITDPVRLRQILLNFVSNAIKFTAHGNVRILASFTPTDSPRGELAIRVVDTGIGLTHEQQSRLFQPFSQADDSHHRLYGGTGLGLAISKRLANLLDGDIEVSSTPGAGSTFTLKLSLQRADALAPKSIPLPANPAPAAPLITPAIGKRILVVDDAPDNRRLLRRLLTHAGFEVDVTEDGAAAITAAIAARNDDHPYDLILMDMLMPNVDGYEATRQLRARGHTGLIFALTAHASPADEQKCLDAGCDGYIAKPFDCELLLARTHEAVRTASSKKSPAQNLN